ncbi:MAG: FxsA family protein [Deltaproteobacteria bacterium]|nr:FxsA family protein [Deltaproteobacteria bacterium]
MGLVLAALFIGVPALEIVLLVKVGGAIGGWWTFAAVVGTGVLGAALAKHQGTAALEDVRTALSTGQKVGSSVAAALLLLVASVLLVTPGFVTDAVGFALLLPWTRRLVAVPLAARLAKGVMVGGSFGGPMGPGGFPGAYDQAGDDDPPPPGVIDV